MAVQNIENHLEMLGTCRVWEKKVKGPRKTQEKYFQHSIIISTL